MPTLAATKMEKPVIGNKFVSTLMFFSAALLWSPAMASDWVKLGVDDDGGTRLLDKASISRDGPIAKVWTKVELAQPTLDEKSAKKIFAVATLIVADCKGTFIGLEKGRAYDADGALVVEKKLTVYTVPQPIDDGPFVKETVALMCKPDRSIVSP